MNSQVSFSSEYFAQHLCELLVAHPCKKRQVIAIAGAPASGKSTTAKSLAHELKKVGRNAKVVPMDGFHLDNTILEMRGIYDRKGSPPSFDLQGFKHLLKRICTPDEDIYFPLFDRQRDIAIAGAGVLETDVEFVIVEGNYLLLNQGGWAELICFWDISVMLHSARRKIRERLIKRWIKHGLNLKAAITRLNINDMPNADLVLQHSHQADWVLKESKPKT